MIDASGAPLPPAGGPAPLGGEVRPLHASEAKTLLACPAMWGHAYRSRRVPLVKSEALSRGTAVHEWLAGWWMGASGESHDSGQALPDDPIARACCIGYAAVYQAPDLANVQVEVPWTATIGGVPCAGTLDAHGTETGADGVLVIVEHKTTSLDISPGSLYWRQVVTTDPQVSMYRAAFPGAKVLYDVLRKPALRQKTTENEDQFVARCVEAMALDPAHYFQRAYVVRLEAEDEAFAEDVRAIDALRRLPLLPRNPASCFAYGRRCDWFPVCWEGASLADDSLFTDQDANR